MSVLCSIFAVEFSRVEVLCEGGEVGGGLSKRVLLPATAGSVRCSCRPVQQIKGQRQTQ